jgi:hypothetical protein
MEAWRHGQNTIEPRSGTGLLRREVYCQPSPPSSADNIGRPELMQRAESFADIVFKDQGAEEDRILASQCLFRIVIGLNSELDGICLRR